MAEKKEAEKMLLNGSRLEKITTSGSFYDTDTITLHFSDGAVKIRGSILVEILRAYKFECWKARKYFYVEDFELKRK